MHGSFPLHVGPLPLLLGALVLKKFVAFQLLKTYGFARLYRNILQLERKLRTNDNQKQTPTHTTLTIPQQSVSASASALSSTFSFPSHNQFRESVKAVLRAPRTLNDSKMAHTLRVWLDAMQQQKQPQEDPKEHTNTTNSTKSEDKGGRSWILGVLHNFLVESEKEANSKPSTSSMDQSKAKASANSAQPSSAPPSASASHSTERRRNEDEY